MTAWPIPALILTLTGVALFAPVLGLRAPPDVHITAEIPSLVAISGESHRRGDKTWGKYNASDPMTGEFGPWFPQTMHLHRSGALLLSYQTSPDTLDEEGWMGQHYSSIDGGHTSVEFRRPASSAAAPPLAESSERASPPDVHTYTCMNIKT
eukprot:SAG11_NODE_4973_length_1707_cov_1.200249_3_plen_152_part_00